MKPTILRQDTSFAAPDADSALAFAREEIARGAHTVSIEASASDAATGFVVRSTVESH